MHPLMSNPADLTDQELTEKITKILVRLDFFARSGHSASYAQAQTIYHTLVQEQQDRIARNYITDDEQFGDLIDIRKP
jgi:hypothetical protein